MAHRRRLAGPAAPPALQRGNVLAEFLEPLQPLPAKHHWHFMGSRTSRGMTREDAQALLDLVRLDRTPPPSVDGERMMRCYVEIISGGRASDGRGNSRRD